MERFLWAFRVLGTHGATANARAEVELQARRTMQVELVVRRVERARTAAPVPAAAAAGAAPLARAA